jgi:long-chain acyl-CoA synthetase
MDPETQEQPAFGLIADMIRRHAGQRPQHLALLQDDRTLDYRGLTTLMDRVAAALQRDGVGVGDVVAICAHTSIEYAATFLGAVGAGVVVAPLAPTSTPATLRTMLADCGARILFLDEAVAAALGSADVPPGPVRIRLDQAAGSTSLADWLAPAGAPLTRAHIDPAAPFNIIYSSGTTGAPKGIVQSHRMRWAHVRRAAGSGYDTAAVTMCSTPLYSNTTLVSLFPALACGGAVILMPKFDAAGFLQLAERHRATHAMLVPVQYQRIMDQPDFGRHDLSSFRMKFCTSAPFAAALKADVLERWPGGLTEYYGMTEGGGTCILYAHKHPDKLHTVGQPSAEHDVRLIDEQGREVPQGQPGEVVGRSMAMMNGYHNQPQQTAAAEWYDATGQRFIRTGDIGRFDADGFLTLLDRKKDMVISGGFNIYPSDLEAVLLQHPAVADAAVVAMPSRQWGETPVAFVVLKPGFADPAEQIRTWANERLGKTQRLGALQILASLPRSAIGKVLKRELREQHATDF